MSFKDSRVMDYADQRHEEFRQRMEEQNKRLHAAHVAYENYMYYSRTPEEKAMNRALWLNLSSGG